MKDRAIIKREGPLRSILIRLVVNREKILQIRGIALIAQQRDKILRLEYIIDANYNKASAAAAPAAQFAGEILHPAFIPSFDQKAERALLDELI